LLLTTIRTGKNAILSGLPHQAVANNNATQIAQIIEAIKFLKATIVAKKVRKQCFSPIHQ